MKNRSRWLAKKLLILNYFSFVFLLLNTLPVFAGPEFTTYQAKIIKPDGYPLEASNVNFRFSILDPLGSCILYSENYSSVNMANSGGVISFALGSGVKTYPVSAVTFAQVFSNITPNLSCDAGGPGTYSPQADDVRKIVMQFHDGGGWQTLPAMNINAVPYAMYANVAQSLAGLPTCTPGQALNFNGVSFSCETIGGGGVTSGTITTALGYTPANGASFTLLDSTLTTVSSSVFSVSATVASLSSSITSLQSSVAASFAALSGGQWSASGTSLYYDSGTVGIGTASASASLDVSGSVRISGKTVMGNNPPVSGTFDFGLFGANASYDALVMRQHNVTSLSSTYTTGEINAIQINPQAAGATHFFGELNYVYSNAANTNNSANMSASYNISEHRNSGNINQSIGLGAAAVHNGSGNIANLIGGLVQVINYGSGTVTQQVGLQVMPGYGDANIKYGIKINDQNIDATSATYNLYSEGTTAANYFDGTVGLGVLEVGQRAGLARLEIAAGSTSRAPIKLNAGTLLATATSGTIEYDGSNLYYTDDSDIRRTIATVGSGGAVTSGSIISALGYAPVSNAVVSSLQSSVAASFAALTGSQWTASGSTISYTAGDIITGNTPPSGGQFDFGPLLGSPAGYKSPYFSQNTLTDFSAAHTFGNVNSVKLNASNSNFSIVAGNLNFAQNVPGNTRDYGSVRSGLTVMENDGSGTMAEMIGQDILTLQAGSGLITSTYGVMARNYTYAGSVVNSYGGYFASANQGGVMTNSYGLFVDSNTGSATNSYGLYVADQNFASATQKYNIYSQGVNTKNFFAGYVGVGVASPTARLHLTSGSSTTAPLKLSVGTVLSSPQSGAVEYDGTYLYYTDNSNARRTIATLTGSGSAITSSAVISALGYTPVSNAGGSSQWSTSATTINYLTGNVGIGTENPAQALVVSGITQATRFYAGDGAFNSPSFTFASSPGTGLHNNGGNLGISVGSALKGIWSTNSLAFNAGGAGPQIYFTGGSEANPSYAFNVDSDTGMFNPNAGGGSNELAFSTSATEKLRISAAGNVGIGTSTPAGRLDVAWGGASGFNGGADMNASTRTNNTNKWFRYSQSHYANATQPFLAIMTGSTNSENGVYIGGGSAVQPNATAIRFYTGLSQTTAGNAVERMTILPSGRVGIGQTNPTVNLEVSGTRTSSATLASAVTKVGGDDVYLYTGAYNGTPSYAIWQQSMRSTDSQVFPLVFNPNGGNVGIGTATPGYKLSVYEGSASVVHNIESGNNGSAAYVRHSGRTAAGVAQTYGSGLNISDGNGGYEVYDFTAGSSRLFINASGSVGVGTISPAQKLHISEGDILIERSTTSPSLKLNNTFTGGRQFTLFSHASGSGGLSRFIIKDTTSATERFVITDAGNVGIGTANPLSLLHLDNSAGEEGITGIFVQDPTSNASFGGSLYYDDRGGLNLFKLAVKDSDIETGYVAIDRSSGNVGVKNSNPAAVLDVGGSVLLRGGAAHAVAAPTYAGTFFSFDGATNTAGLWSVNASTSQFAFYTKTGGSDPGTERMRISATGNIGIGAVLPDTRLHVASAAIMASNGVGAIFKISTPNSANSDYMQFGWLSEDNWAIMTADSATHRNLVVTPWGGNLGVGNVSPSYKLDVSGDIRITGTPYRNGGDSAWIVPSDARLKDVTGSYQRGLREIANIDTIYFNYKKDNAKAIDSSVSYTGVIAQQVQKQIPEAVKEDKDGFLSLNTTPIFWAMVNAVKELYYDIVGIKAENAELKAQTEVQARKIQSLEAENAAIKQRLERIEKSLQQNK